MDDEHNRGRLRTRPAPPNAVVGPGLHPLGLGQDRDGLLYVPDADGARPLLVVLHGATMNAAQMARPLLSVADDHGLVLLVPDSREATWDILMGGYGADIEFIDNALIATFERAAVDPDAVFVGGVSDGASYALSVGVANGDLFSRVVAFSPGFMAPVELVGKPEVFVSHGIRDQILPIDRCGRPIVAGLHAGGYDVEYLEFDGGHEMPDAVVRTAVNWLTKPQPDPDRP